MGTNVDWTDGACDEFVNWFGGEIGGERRYEDVVVVLVGG